MLPRNIGPLPCATSMPGMRRSRYNRERNFTSPGPTESESGRPYPNNPERTTGCSALAALRPVQFFLLLAQAVVATHQAADVENVNRPGSGVSGVQEFDGIHCGPRR